MSDRPDCRCGHTYDWHDHYRAGTDCGACPPNYCPYYRKPPGRFWRWVEKVLG